jgi:hypothetical protein
MGTVSGADLMRCCAHEYQVATCAPLKAARLFGEVSPMFSAAVLAGPQCLCVYLVVHAC